MARNPFTTAELVPRYLVTLVTLVTAAVAGVITTFGSARFLASRGGQHPVDALLAGEAVALAVLVVVAFVTARRTDSDTIERICRHILWGDLRRRRGAGSRLVRAVAVRRQPAGAAGARGHRGRLVSAGRGLPPAVGAADGSRLLPARPGRDAGTVGLALGGWHWGDGCSCCCRSRWRSPSAGHSFSP